MENSATSGFRKWTRTVDIIKRFEIKITHEKKKLEGIIQDYEDVQQSKRHLALLSTVDLFMEDLLII